MGSCPFYRLKRSKNMTQTGFPSQRSPKSDRLLEPSRPRIMGILNVTPDSFADGGAHFSLELALSRARQMVEEGADLIDVGGESTRPGSQGVSLQQELDRVIPVIEAICAELPIPVSVDTSKPQVMRDSVAAGAGLINDVMALRQPGALQAARDLGVPVCLMHMLGEPRSMQKQPAYQDVVAEVRGFLEERVHACEEAGIPRENLLLDPGFGLVKIWTTISDYSRICVRLPISGYPCSLVFRVNQ